MKLRSYIYSMLAGVAVFTLASCADSVSEFFGLEDKEVISFTATAEEEIEDVTRAAIEEDSRVTKFQNTQPKKPLLLCSSVTERDEAATRGHRVTTADSLKAFRVSAFLTNKNISPEVFATTSPNFFYDLKAERNANGVFDIEHKYYWPGSNEKLWFYAYTPCDDSNVQISGETATGAQKVSFTVDTDVTKQVDLMTANTETTGFTSASGNTTKTSTPLNFRHELTAIRFVIGEQWLAGSIKSIGIYNVHGRGTMTIGDDDATKWEWKNKAGNAVGAVDDFVLTLNKGGLSGTSGEEFIEDTNLYFLMIPQSFDNNNDAYVEVKYQDNSREYTVRAPLKGQSAWVRNTTVTYAISSHELTKLKIGSIIWPDETAADAFKGIKTAFAAGDAVGLYVVNPDGDSIQTHYRNVKCTYDGGSWTVHHPEGHPVFKLPGYQYFFYYPYTPTPDTKYPVRGQQSTNTAATAFFSHLINGWAPSKIQNKLDSLAAQDLQVGKGVDDANLSSTVNAEMAHQMSIGKLLLGKSQATDTYIYQVDNDHKWYYHPAKRDVTASNNFSTNKPYLHSDGNYYFIFKPVDSTSDAGTLLKGLDGTTVDWSWEMKSTDRGKTLTHTAISADEGKNTVYTDKLVFTPIADLTANGGNVTVPVEVLLNNSALTKGTHYTVSFKNASNQTVTAPTVAGNYTAIFTPKGIYWGDDVSLAFTVNKDGKTITFGNVTQVNKTYGDAAFTQAVTKTGTGTVTYSSSNTDVATVNSSTGQVTIKAAGSATITATVQDSQYDHYATNTASYTLTVNPKSVTSPTITLGTTSYTYDGSAKQPTVSSVKDGSTTIPTSEYNISYSNNTNAGTATVTISDKTGGNYTVSGTKTFTINKKAVTITAKAQTVTYGTGITTGTGQVTASGLLSGHSVSAVTLTQSTTNATTSGTITPSAAAIKDGNNTTVTNNYSITYATGKLTINRKDLGTNSNSFKFTSNAIVKDYIWELNGYSNSTLTKPSDCTVTYTNSSVPGVATVNSSGVLTAGGTVGSSTTTTITVTATGNYTGTATYTIYAKSATRDFGLTKSVVGVTLPKGTYKLEVWGAGVSEYAKGGYSYGDIALSASTNLYVCVGQAGGGVDANKGENASFEAYNGGGYVGRFGIGGAGATHIAKDSNLGELANYSSTANRAKVILVAGGAGGTDGGTGGHGGGTNGSKGSGDYVAANAGTQSGGGSGVKNVQPSQGTSGGTGTFGKGGTAGYALYNSSTWGNNYKDYGSGGGGGWYGGGGSQYAGCGGGGSGYTNTSLLKSGTYGMQNGVLRSGATVYDGYARITWKSN